jgi:hypothetical protein
VLAVETQEGVEVIGQGLDVVADAADAELPELGQVLADLRGGEVVALRHLLRGDPLDAELLEMAQTAQIEREPVEGKRRDLFLLVHFTVVAAISH